MNKDFIFRIENLAKKEQLRTSSLKEEDGGLVANFTYNAIAQIVQATNENEMRAVCMAIDEYIRENNIDICYAINEDVLNDLLHNHEQLYKRLYAAEEQNKRVLEKLDIITRSNQELELLLNGNDKMKTMSIKGVKKLKRENEQLKKQLSKADEEIKKNENALRGFIRNCGNASCELKNSKAIEVLDDVKYHCMQETETLKYDFNTCVGVVNYIDSQISELRRNKDETSK